MFRVQFASCHAAGISHRNYTVWTVARERHSLVGLVIAVLLLALILGGLGFAVHFLWIIAVIAFLIWLIGFFVARAERRWYHW